MKVIAYVRVSTDRQGVSGLGLQAQRDRITAMCLGRGHEIVEWRTEEASARSVLKRPILTQVLKELSEGKYEGLVVSKLDRLARSVVDFGNILKTSQEQKWDLVIGDPDVDTSNASGKLMLNIFAAFAEFESAVISERTKAALVVNKQHRGSVSHHRIPFEMKLMIHNIRKENEFSFEDLRLYLGEQNIRNPIHGSEYWSKTSLKNLVKWCERYERGELGVVDPEFGTGSRRVLT